MRSARRPIAVDLFAGAGGMTLGFEQAGFDVLAAVEIDPIHCATHEFNFPFWRVICASVIDITGSKIRKRSDIGDRDIDVVFGGPPCQGFSLMGKRALDDPRNSLVFHFMRLVMELQPKYFVMENVKGLTIGKHRQFLSEVMEEFEQRGYKVETNYKVLNACHYGVPQNRQRLFLLGCRTGFSLPEYPAPITKPPKGRKLNKELASLPSCPTVWDAIADLPEVECHPELLHRDWFIDEYGNPSPYSRVLRGLTILTDDYSYERQYNEKVLTSSRRSIHTLKSIERFAATKHGETEPVSHFLKLDPAGICNTLRAGTASNRGAFTSPRPIHPFTPRCITVREAARLHSYPDWFRFHATKWHGFRQIGNSVPPSLAKAVAAKIMEILNTQPIKPDLVKDLGDERMLRFKMSQAAKSYRVNPHAIEPRVGRPKAIKQGFQTPRNPRAIV